MGNICVLRETGKKEYGFKEEYKDRYLKDHTVATYPHKVKIEEWVEEYVEEEAEAESEKEEEIEVLKEAPPPPPPKVVMSPPPQKLKAPSPPPPPPPPKEVKEIVKASPPPPPPPPKAAIKKAMKESQPPPIYNPPPPIISVSEELHRMKENKGFIVRLFCVCMVLDDLYKLPPQLSYKAGGRSGRTSPNPDENHSTYALRISPAAHSPRAYGEGYRYHGHTGGPNQHESHPSYNEYPQSPQYPEYPPSHSNRESSLDPHRSSSGAGIGIGSLWGMAIDGSWIRTSDASSKGREKQPSGPGFMSRIGAKLGFKSTDSLSTIKKSDDRGLSHHIPMSTPLEKYYPNEDDGLVILQSPSNPQGVAKNSHHAEEGDWGEGEIDCEEGELNIRNVDKGDIYEFN